MEKTNNCINCDGALPKDFDSWDDYPLCEECSKTIKRIEFNYSCKICASKRITQTQDGRGNVIKNLCNDCDSTDIEVIREVVRKTNFERITASVEALAEWRVDESRCKSCSRYNEDFCKNDHELCKKSIADWLRATAE